MEKCKNLEQEWLQLVERGKLPQIQKLQKEINDVEIRGCYVLNNVKHNGVTGLIIAAHVGNKELVRWFIVNKADVNARTHLGWRAIHFAAKRGHVATIDILCSSGAEVDPVTLNNETPLSLALDSHMRDSVRKLVNLGAKVERFNESILCRYLHRGVLPAEVLSRIRTNFDSPTNKLRAPHQVDSALPSEDSTDGLSHTGIVDCGGLPGTTDFAIAVQDSQVIINQLQYQSTSYDLELARRKRELIRRLPSVCSLTQQVATILVQQTHRLARADLPALERLQAVRRIFDVLPLKILDSTEEPVSTPLGSVIEPYLRLFEACMCESHCPSALAVELSFLSLYMVLLGGGKNVDLNGSSIMEAASDTSVSFERASSIAFYVTRLLRKLVSKNNPQYRAGILSHLCRMLSWSTDGKYGMAHPKLTNFWPDLARFTSVLFGLVRLGETLDQPTNIARLAALVGLVGRRLSEVIIPSLASSSTGRFSDLADILVGWGVDSGSIARGIKLDSIHEELRYGLSSWWLHPSDKSARSDVACVTSEEVPLLNPSIHEMIRHLLEDSEKSMNTALLDCQALASNQPAPSNSKPSDPMYNLISVNLFLSVLSSIVKGVSDHLSPQCQIYLYHSLGLSDMDKKSWIDRLLQLLKSAHNCYHINWMPWHGSPTSFPRLSFSVIDQIESTVLHLLDTFSPSFVTQPVYSYLTNRLLDSDHLTMSPECLKACLNLLEKLILQCISDSSSRRAAVEILNTCFGVRSIIHAYKSCCTVGSSYEPASKLVLRTLCNMSRDVRLHDSLCQLTVSDLKWSVRFLKVTDSNKGLGGDDRSKCESLCLFSLALVSSMLRFMTAPAARLSLRRQILTVFNEEYAASWREVPFRVRIAILVLLNEKSFLTSLLPCELVSMVLAVSHVWSASPLEYNCVLDLVGESMDNPSLNSVNRCTILISLCKLAKGILNFTLPLHTPTKDPFVTCVRILIAHAFSGEFHQNEQLNRYLFALSDSTLCRSQERIEVCNDLMLALSMSNRCPLACKSVSHLGLTWYTSRRPDRSATALVTPSGATRMSSNPVVGSGSAYPSLPAVAGVLGFLTRGTSYSSVARYSRLYILEEPSDWIRRLFYLICPIPVEFNPKHFVADAEETVLWYAAWTMVDYKLKVAPWVDPSKTFLSLEGTMRAILRPCTVSKTVNNPTTVANFHVASSLALSRQPWPRQIRQAQSLTIFLGFLERLIANATDGFALALPRPVAPVCEFFAASENTCSRWFARTHGLLLRISAGWPLSSAGCTCSTSDVPAYLLYHAYSLLTAIMQSAELSLDFWLSGGTHHGVSCDFMIHVARALYRLTAWEELQALSDWTVLAFGQGDKESNPFSWLEGLALLTRGCWDSALKIFRSFIECCLQQKQSAQNFHSLGTAWAVSLAYTTELLLQCYADEGDIQAAFRLRDLVLPILDTPRVSESNTAGGILSSFKWTCMRLSYFEKLSSWSSSNASVPELENTEDEHTVFWSYEKFTTDLCRCMVDVGIAVKSDTTNGLLLETKAGGRLSDLVTNIRLASAATLISSKHVPCMPVLQGGLIGEASLCTWLTRADLLLNPSSRCLSDWDLISCRTNTVSESFWRHLIANGDGTDAQLNSTLQGCRWACDMGNFELAQRLLLRQLRTLSLIDHPSDENLQEMYGILCSTRFSDTNRLTEIQRLLFYDCLAQLLWVSNDLSQSFDSKLAAIDMLSRGLRTAIRADVTPDPTCHAARCHVSTQVALRLFNWLEEPSQQANRTWFEWIHDKHADQENGSCSCTSSIVSHLSHFSRLVDERWLNGVPVTPTADLPSVEPFNQSASYLTYNNHSVWLTRLLMMTTRLAPNGSSSAAWLRMAAWCYTRGKAMVNQTRAIVKALVKEPSNWTDPEVTLNSVVCPVLQVDDYFSVRKLLEQHGVLPSSAANGSSQTMNPHVPIVMASLLTFLTPEQPPSEGSNDKKQEYEKLIQFGSSPNLQLTKLCPDDETTEQICNALERHLRRTVPQLFSNLSPTKELLKSLHRIVIELTHRQYTLHTSAAQAYATYLTVAGQQTGFFGTGMAEPISKLDTTTATLKLLDLLSCPSRALRNLIANFLMRGEPASIVHDPQRLDSASGVSLTHHHITNDSGATLGGPAIWEACLHQVLVRLTLPDPTIRNCLVALLKRLILSGRESRAASFEGSKTRWRGSSLRFAEHLVFPSVVAALDSMDKSVILASLTKSATTKSSDFGHHDTLTSNPDSCFGQIVSALQSAGLSNLVKQVETFVLELQRITLLWEELWLGSLLQHWDELTKKVTLLEAETKRSVQLNNLSHQSQSENNAANKENRASAATTSDNKALFVPLMSIQDVLRIKFVAVAQPTLDLISHLSSLTLNVQPETPHEEWFQRTFGPTIRGLRETLSHPSDLMNTRSLLNSVRQLIYLLQTAHRSATTIPTGRILYGEQRAPVRTARPSLGSVLHLSLSHLSPRLTQMHFGMESDSPDLTSPGIPLPGRPELESAYLINRIAILPTKTKPKRLLFRARNGQTYPYLLKGLEDLRLDDRIMRLFELVNVALAHQKDIDPAQLKQMCSRTYAITPLGVRAGLLQMVHGAIPLFSLYKRWQIRRAKPTGLADGSDSSTVVVLRPGELFHSRLKAFLTAVGLSYDPQLRDLWPMETLRNVFHSLERETPVDLLSRELWAFNPSAASWWSASRTFSRSIGLMSMLGYLVGLGDRHLDNVLTDLTTGHLIHIDYNVCFDKGRTLRVAERVPFRLTQILRHTLGPIAQDRFVRGTFRVAAEKTLAVVRTVVDPLLIQLKSFLIDPLVDWQDKRQAISQQNLIVTDFTHLSAYYGGGSSANRNHYWASCLRKQNRVLAEERTYAGLLVAHLYKLCNSAVLLDVCSALTAARSHFQAWVTWSDACQNVAQIEHNYRLLSTSNRDELDKADVHCRDVELASDAVVRLRTSLHDQLTTWKTEVTQRFRIFRQLADPTWLPSLITIQDASSSEIASALLDYHLLARVYLSHPHQYAADNPHRTQELFAIQAALQRFLDGSESLDICLDHFSHLSKQQISVNPDEQLVMLLDKAIRRSKCVVNELEDRITMLNVPEVNTLSSAIRPELDNLHLFFYDQGVLGVGAYIWALIDYLPSVIGNTLSLESAYDSDGRGDSMDTVISTTPLDHLSFSSEYITALFSVLRDRSTGAFRFTAGFEADVHREMAFMYAVRDATLYLSQLRTNLIRLLLLPETESALIDATSSPIVKGETEDLVEQFTGLMARYVTESDPSGLKDRVDHFLSDVRTTLADRDLRLHQVLFAVHLTLINATNQMEEIAVRVRELTATAPAWFYVDIIAQCVSNLLARCTSWRTGATSLWGWESTNRVQSDPTEVEPDFRCSWVDEIYAMGLMAFISVLEEGRSHWNAIRDGSAAATQDLALGQPSDAIDRYISRLISRTGLCSLMGFAFGRLFCSLVEDTGIQIRRLLIEAEHSAKVAGVHNVILQLSAEKLAETVTVHLSTIQPVGVHHLRGPASNLISRLAVRANQANDFLSNTIKLELARKNQARLQQSLTVLKWMSSSSIMLPNSDSREPTVEQATDKAADEEKEASILTSPSLANVLCILKRVVTKAEDNFTTTDPSTPSLCEVGKAICFAEELRISGLTSSSGFLDTLHLLTDLKNALVKKAEFNSLLTDLEKALITLKSQYSLSWPSREWLNQNIVVEVASKEIKRTLRAQLQDDVRTAKAYFIQTRDELSRVKVELLNSSVIKGNSGSSTNPTDHSVAASFRQAVKRFVLKHTGPGSPGLNLIPNPNDPSLLPMAKEPSLVVRWRTALNTLQLEGMFGIFQLVKYLNRYETVRSQLAVDGFPSVTHTWSSWLENYRTWTDFVLATSKELSKFLAQLVSPDSSVDCTRQHHSVTDERNEPERLRMETKTAEHLLDNCVAIQSNLWSLLLEPLFDVLRHTVASDEALSELVSTFLPPVESRLQKWVYEDSFQPKSSLQLTSRNTHSDDSHFATDTGLMNACQNEINAQALEIWYRTRDRLMGRDPLLMPFRATANDDVAAKSSRPKPREDNDCLPVSEQVDACIRAATDIDNLALMYEGWAAWV